MGAIGQYYGYVSGQRISKEQLPAVAGCSISIDCSSAGPGGEGQMQTKVLPDSVEPGAALYPISQVRMIGIQSQKSHVQEESCKSYENGLVYQLKLNL